MITSAQMLFQAAPLSLVRDNACSLAFSAKELQYARRNLARNTRRRRRRSNNNSHKEFKPLPTLYEEVGDDRWSSFSDLNRWCSMADDDDNNPAKPMESNITIHIVQAMNQDRKLCKDVQPFLPLRMPMRRASFDKSEGPKMNTLEMIDQVLADLALNDESLYGDD
jgi:hypothetical protein